MLPRRRRDSAAISQYDRVKRRSTAMAQEQNKPSGPDLSQGVAIADLAGGKLLGHVGDEDVLLVQSGGEIFAVGAHCTHYHGPLAEGLVVGETVRCPWHHACLDLRTGEAARAPALSPISCWNVERRDGRVFVKEKSAQPKPRGKTAKSDAPQGIVIGGGAAGFAAAEMLRRRDYRGSIVMLSDDDAAPVDRPNLSKDYLAGSAPEDWLPLRPDDFYGENGIDRCRTGAAYDSRRRSAPCSYFALARRLSRDHQGGEERTARSGDRRKLRWLGSRGIAARARRRGSCRGARNTPDGAGFWCGARRSGTRFARGARRCFSSWRHRDCNRRQARRSQERRCRRGPACRRRRRRAAALGACRTGRTRHRSRRDSE